MRPGSEANADDERLWTTFVAGGANEDTSTAGRDSTARRAHRESIDDDHVMVGCELPGRKNDRRMSFCSHTLKFAGRTLNVRQRRGLAQSLRGLGGGIFCCPYPNAVDPIE